MTARPNPSSGIENWWLALVTFERRNEMHSEFLPDHCQGAAGWMACHSDDGEALRDLIEAALAEAGLRLVEITETRLAGSFNYVRELDSHLAANIVALEPGKLTVWGTIHTYRADGTAGNP